MFVQVIHHLVLGLKDLMVRLMEEKVEELIE
jgi:hypothetical protein